MINIYAVTVDALKSLGYPVREQGTYAPTDTLPETFATYQIIDSPNNSAADNLPTSQTTRVQVNLYSRDPEIKQVADDLLKSVMIPAGFLRAGGRDLPFSLQTGHYGYTCDYRFYDSI
ncbi:hypothetical protein J41TS12_17410 [Paenibacillus antibioticophila]|uniref:DUF3168 domain-containing protein n=1 Tax=Paenibacillus antibioticophila TaxID=1274374 RepID=A0A920CER5_9BACL|nr:hypothetical protein [Paenibacillus antibioticophila]GIO36880.1 hypothetical protein J41TS12_17410 [Paenibacillus antibioticophila]